ncbi:MAG: hypothetical protein IPM39_24500 [Chloroflexi bacterium]|nr:hypothetical protein [Chloroflexota bacterium]
MFIVCPARRRWLQSPAVVGELKNLDLAAARQRSDVTHSQECVAPDMGELAVEQLVPKIGK